MEGSTNVALAKGGARMPLRIPVPPLPEQRRIAAVLTAVQRAVDAAGAADRPDGRAQEGAMHKLFTRGICGEAQKRIRDRPIHEA